MGRRGLAAVRRLDAKLLTVLGHGAPGHGTSSTTEGGGQRGVGEGMPAIFGRPQRLQPLLDGQRRDEITVA